MVELKIYLTDELNAKFRRLAMSAYGYGRGSLSKAAEEALAKWCTEHDEPVGQSVPKIDDQAKKVVSAGVNPDEREVRSSSPRAAEAEESAEKSAIDT